MYYFVVTLLLVLKFPIEFHVRRRWRSRVEPNSSKTSIVGSVGRLVASSIYLLSDLSIRETGAILPPA